MCESPDMFGDTSINSEDSDSISTSIGSITLQNSAGVSKECGLVDTCGSSSNRKDNPQGAMGGKVVRPHSPDDDSNNKKYKQDHQNQPAESSEGAYKSDCSNTQLPLCDETAGSPERIHHDLSEQTRTEEGEQLQQEVNGHLPTEPAEGRKSRKDKLSSTCGTPLTALMKMTLDAPSVPPVSPSSSHTVMVQLPLTPGLSPRPFSRHQSDCWDDQHVRMPCSPMSHYPLEENKIVPRWEVIRDALSCQINDFLSLKTAILSYNGRYRQKWDFAGLEKLLREFDDCERDEFFSGTLPRMCQLALRLPDLLPAPPPLLRANIQAAVTLSQLQVASLLVNAFFCTFPRRNAKGRDTEYANFPDINFNRLLNKKDPEALEKMKCLLSYFRVVTQKEPVGCITLHRQVVENATANDWQRSTSLLPRLHCDHSGFIEETPGLLQVDFANRFLGGGVLGCGCVQEEIRFVLCPELLVTRLLVEALDKTEALVVIGVEQYNKSVGYGRSFKFDGVIHDTTACDPWGRRLCQLVAIDAFHFNRDPRQQYMEPFIVRELNKAYAGFRPLLNSNDTPVAVATGNWGCGAFKGDPKLKALLQMAACGYVGRDVAYFTFGDRALRDHIVDMHEFLCQNNVSVGRLVQCLCQYGQQRDNGRFLYRHLYLCLGSDTASPQPSPVQSPQHSPELHPHPSSGDAPTVPSSTYRQQVELPAAGLENRDSEASSWRNQSRNMNSTFPSSSKGNKRSNTFSDRNRRHNYNEKITDHFSRKPHSAETADTAQRDAVSAEFHQTPSCSNSQTESGKGRLSGTSKSLSSDEISQMISSEESFPSLQREPVQGKQIRKGGRGNGGFGRNNIGGGDKGKRDRGGGTTYNSTNKEKEKPKDKQNNSKGNGSSTLFSALDAADEAAGFWKK